jgi:hypothetical protein
VSFRVVTFRLVTFRVLTILDGFIALIFFRAVVPLLIIIPRARLTLVAVGVPEAPFRWTVVTAITRHVPPIGLPDRIVSIIVVAITIGSRPHIAPKWGIIISIILGRQPYGMFVRGRDM